jgi:general secretion pathway protein A
MYLDFHGFREKPFNLTPDPRFVFLSKTHKEAFAHLLYGINNHAGFIALTGEVGSGKTTVLRALLNQLDADHHRTALIFNPCLSPAELLRNINREFGIQTHPSDHASSLDALNLFLLQQNAEGRTVVLIIDEAQDLEAPVLEQIRLISNLETDREKLIQIVLSAQPELLRILERNEMRQLSQRITVRYHLQSMDFEDTVRYVNHRLVMAGGRGDGIFSMRALKRIYRYSHGLPRLINAACDRALLTGYTRDTTRITSQIAATGIKDIRRNTAAYARRRRLIMIPAFTIVIVLIVVSIYLTRPDFINQWIPTRIKATVEQTKGSPLATGKGFSRAMAVELGGVSESESARRAFNTLASLWKVSPVPESVNLDSFNGMERAALDRELHHYKFSGNLGALLRIGYPAALELTLPKIPGKRFISLVGMESEQFLIDPPIAGRRSLSVGELEKHWSGKGFLLWKDPLNLLADISQGAEGSHIKRLQDLLKEAGTYSRPLTGIYDGDTVLAVKKFQSSKGIDEDGIVGVQTLMFLYGSIKRFELPRLKAGRK